MHKHGFAFPEVTANYIPEYRDLLYLNLCAKAKVVISESSAGRNDILRYYGDIVEAHRIHTIDMLPISFSELGGLINLSETPSRKVLELVGSQYFLYPAQFWEHKNHITILRAARLLINSGVTKFKCVFTGTYSDFYTATNFKKLQNEVQELGLENYVSFLGFVSDVDLRFLYLHAQGLLFPSYFGPSNLPPLEAIYLNCPVVAADVYGMREFLADKVQMVEPDDISGWAEAIKNLLDPIKRADLINEGRELLEVKKWQTSCKQLIKVINTLVNDSENREHL